MRVYFTRDSVGAGDGGDAPHARQLGVPEGVATDVLVRLVSEAAQLPQIAGGEATWCVSSRVPLAVIAQQWREPRLLSSFLPALTILDFDGRTVRLHFSYFAQRDPQ